MTCTLEPFDQLDAAHPGHQGIDEQAALAAWTVSVEKGLPARE